MSTTTDKKDTTLSTTQTCVGVKESLAFTVQSRAWSITKMLASDFLFLSIIAFILFSAMAWAGY